jgi:peptidoglycan/xylan/chitin deacetylase (PgdA/CDA1 family)
VALTLGMACALAAGSCAPAGPAGSNGARPAAPSPPANEWTAFTRTADRVRPRALVLGPPTLWTDARFDLDNNLAALDQAGVPYDLQPQSRAWDTLAPVLSQYSLLVIPGYIEAGALSDALLEAIEGFARAGGVVVVTKPLGDEDQTEALHLAGLRAVVKQPRTTELRIDGAGAPALVAFDSPEERVVPLVDPAEITPTDVWTFDPDPQAGTTALAHAYAGSAALGVVATRRPLGRGAVYAWGHDLATFDGARCYVNCFEPSGDLLRLFLRDAFREGAAGHAIFLHTMPGAHDSALILTHDIDAPDAYSAGPWGDPGAPRMAAMEKRHGARATYNITTDYVAGYFRPEILRQLCDLGMCPLGDHSVRHLVNFDALPAGDGQVTRATYDPAGHPTVSGEVRVPAEILWSVTGQRPTVWRSGYLLVNPALYDTLADNGFETGSDFGIGDLKYNLPVDAARTGLLQQTFHHRSIFELPVVCEDGMGSAAFKRQELQKSNVEVFEAAWLGALLRNADNDSVTTLLVHPSRGRDVPDDNLQVKIDAVERILVSAQQHGIALDTLEHYGHFWRARAQVHLDGGFDASGYRGTIRTGALPITDLTLAFGEPIGTFVCPACGAVEVHVTRVVLRATLPAGTSFRFSALPAVR